VEDNGADISGTGADKRFAIIENDCYDACVSQARMVSLKLAPRACTAVFVLSLVLPALAAASESTAFSDVPSGTDIAEAAEYLRGVGVLSGYPDPSDPSGQVALFRPDQKVNRAEAIKIIIAPILKPEALSQLTSSPFNDVKNGDWFLPYVEAARQNSVVDGPPTKVSFFGSQPVKKMEFIKMLLLAYRIDPNAYSEIRLPLSADASDPTAWYYPYLRYAITASMTMVSTEGLLDPSRELSRGDASLLLYRFLMYREGRRTQALLSEAESEILVVLGNLDAQNIEQAEYASARALLAARGANTRFPEQTLVQGALKITESFRALVRAYRAGLNQNLEETVRLCGDAWNLAARGKELNAELTNVSEQVQGIAKKMAESARASMSSNASAQ